MWLTFIASFLPILLFLSIPFMWWSDGKKLKEATLHSVISSIIAFVVAELSKFIFNTPRPFELNQKLPLTLTVPWDAAFPSAHTAVVFALSTAIFLHNRKWGFFLMTLSALIGVARVMAHVHYPVDIIGGIVIGVLVSILVNKVHFYRHLNT